MTVYELGALLHLWEMWMKSATNKSRRETQKNKTPRSAETVSSPGPMAERRLGPRLASFTDDSPSVAAAKAIKKSTWRRSSSNLDRTINWILWPEHRPLEAERLVISAPHLSDQDCVDAGVTEASSAAAH